MADRSTKIYLAIIVLLSVLVRLLPALLFPGLGNFDSMDALTYTRFAMEMLEGNGFAYKGQPSVFVAPLFPAFIAGVYAIAGANPQIVQIILILLSGVSACLVFQIGRLLFNQQAGLLSALLFAIYPELVGISLFLYTEPLNIPLLLAAVYFLVKGFEQKGMKDFAISGLFWGLAALCKGTTQLFPFVVLAAILVFRRYRIFAKHGVLLIGIYCLTLTPWTIRNYSHFKVFLPIAIGTGESLWTGNYLPFDGLYQYEKTRNLILDKTRDKPYIERDRILREEALTSIRENPLAHIKLAFKKVYRFWGKVYENLPTGEGRKTNALFLLGLSIPHILLLLFSIGGMVRIRQPKASIWLLYLLLLYYTGVHAVTFAVPRYRIPVLPYLFPFAAWGFMWLLDRLSKKKAKIPETVEG